MHPIAKRILRNPNPVADMLEKHHTQRIQLLQPLTLGHDELLGGRVPRVQHSVQRVEVDSGAHVDGGPKVNDLDLRAHTTCNT